MTPRAVVSDWLVVTQDRIDRFADAIGDHQWIHVDPARAERESPYGATVAHGFLTLSLISTLLAGSSPVTARMAVNYGLNRVRFIEPVMAGSRIRARFEQAAVEEKADAKKITWQVTVENEETTCCVAEWIVLYYS